MERDHGEDFDWKYEEISKVWKERDEREEKEKELAWRAETLEKIQVATEKGDPSVEVHLDEERHAQELRDKGYKVKRTGQCRCAHSGGFYDILLSERGGRNERRREDVYEDGRRREDVYGDGIARSRDRSESPPSYTSNRIGRHLQERERK